MSKKMKNDPTIHRFECEDCGKRVVIQCVFELLVKKCKDCWLKEVKSGTLRR